jgi:hypothetical protein
MAMSMQEYFGERGGKTCKYAEKYEASIGRDYLCTNKDYNQEAGWGEEEVFCCDFDSQPECGHFEIRDDWERVLREED